MHKPENEYIVTMPFMKRLVGHLHTVLEHKWLVFKWCCKLGIPMQGIAHDMSKLSPTEFWEGVTYYQGESSPIPVSKKWNNGYSRAWQHHRRALHHYEAWTDNYDFGTVAHMMPYKYALELVADWLAAGETYAKNQGKDFNPYDEITWWQKTRESKRAMHPALKQFAGNALQIIADEEWKSKRELRKMLRDAYAWAIERRGAEPTRIEESHSEEVA